MLECLKVVFAVIAFYCLMFCGHGYWIDRKEGTTWKSIMYILLGWIGVYIIQYLLNN